MSEKKNRALRWAKWGALAGLVGGVLMGVSKGGSLAFGIGMALPAAMLLALIAGAAGAIVSIFSR